MTAGRKTDRILIAGVVMLALGTAAMAVVAHLDPRNAMSGMLGVYVGWANVAVVWALLAYLIVQKIRSR